MVYALPTTYEIASRIDHALLKPNLTREQFEEGLNMATHYSIFSVCVRPADVQEAFRRLEGHTTKVGTVIGFPHGSQHSSVKLFEIKQAHKHGAEEVDVVVDIAKLIDAENNKDIRHIFYQELVDQVRVSNELGLLNKFILETAYLTPELVRLGSDLVVEAGAGFVKTSTGFAGEGATLENILIMLEVTKGSHTKVKASGGVTNLDFVLTLFGHGVERFGTSATAFILDELAARHEGYSLRATYEDNY